MSKDYITTNLLSTLHEFNLEKARIFVLYDINVEGYIKQSIKPILKIKY